MRGTTARRRLRRGSLERGIVVEVRVVEHRTPTDEVLHRFGFAEVVATPQAFDQTLHVDRFVEQVQIDLRKRSRIGR